MEPGVYSAVREGMTNTTTARVDRTPTYTDLAITDLVHRALAAVQDAGRFGDRKVFIASLWSQMLGIEPQTGGILTAGATIEDFKAWLLRARLLTRDGTEDGERLVLLCRADLVAAMDPARVAASETLTDGAAFHFVFDPAIACQEYAPRIRPQAPVRGATAGRVGKVGMAAARRAA
jgi:hypothetical protein